MHQEREGKGLVGEEGEGGKPVLLATVSFFQESLIILFHDQAHYRKAPPITSPPSAAELIKHQKMVYQFCLVRSLTY